MARIHLWFVLICFFSFSCKHDKKGSIQNHSAYDAQWAKSEFDRDKTIQLQFIRYGLPDDKSEYYWSILDMDYHIGIKFSTGCSIESGVQIYNDLMRTEILKRFGKDFLKKVDSQVDSIYKIDEPMIERVKNLNSIVKFENIIRFTAFNTTNDNVKVICGYKWRKIRNKPRMTNLFRVSMNRNTLDIINIDTIQIEVSMGGYR